MNMTSPARAPITMDVAFMRPASCRARAIPVPPTMQFTVKIAEDAGGPTALHIAGLGAAGYATRLDLTRYGLLSMAGSGSSSRTMPATCAGFRPSCLVWPRAVTCCWGRTPQC